MAASITNMAMLHILFIVILLFSAVAWSDRVTLIRIGNKNKNETIPAAAPAHKARTTVPYASGNRLAAMAASITNMAMLHILFLVIFLFSAGVWFPGRATLETDQPSHTLPLGIIHPNRELCSYSIPNLRQSAPSADVVLHFRRFHALTQQSPTGVSSQTFCNCPRFQY